MLKTLKKQEKYGIIMEVDKKRRSQNYGDE